MDKAPAFQFYADDWLGSTKIALMTPAEEGAYIRLLAHAWNSHDCAIPGDDETLAVLSRLGPKWMRSKHRILSCFRKRKDGRYVNARLLKERAKQLNYRESKIKAGKEGAAKRWHSHSKSIAGGVVSAMPLPMAKDSSSSSSSSPTPEGGGAIHSGVGDAGEEGEIGRTVEAFGYCSSPGNKAKTDAIRDLRRQGVSHEYLRAVAQAPDSQKRDFYDLLRAMKNGKKVAFVSKPSGCPHCGGSKTIAGDVVDGKVLTVECPYCKK